ncbi:hypothetical protein [Limnospira platensis]|uniref:hypothetical protein n=1 Tax=Limnospira platensis TaxID=118562 RepID=UPI0021A99BFF
MQYYFTGFIVLFFLVCYGYSYVIVKLAKDRGDQFLLYGMLGGYLGLWLFVRRRFHFCIGCLTNK